jgi:hypothetical protein
MAICVYCGGRGTQAGFECPMCHGSGKYPYMSPPPLVNTSPISFSPVNDDEDEDDDYEDEEDWEAIEEEYAENPNKVLDKLAERWQKKRREYLDRSKYDHDLISIQLDDVVRRYEAEGWINLGIQPGLDGYYHVVRKKT